MRNARIKLKKEHQYRPSVRRNGQHAYGGVEKKKTTSKKSAKKDIAASFNRYKFYKGKQYTGTTIGRRQKWYYDKGEWKDRKITPDKWEIHYAVTKRRAGHAPEGSGAPVGTEYHWYILAHQFVKKLNANDYSTEMTGIKYKVAHKRADKDKWNITDKGQHKRLIKMLKEFIDELEKQNPSAVRKAKTEERVKTTPKKRATKNKKAKEKELVEA
jgi:hypothetical protein